MSSDHAAPISVANDALKALDLFVDVAARGMAFAAQGPKWAKLFPDVFEGANRAAHEAAASFAQRQLDDGLPMLFHTAAVRLWTIVEACVGDLARALIVNEPRVLIREDLNRIKGPLLPFVRCGAEEQAGMLLAALREQTRAPLLRGVGQFEALLNLLGLGGGVNDSVRAALMELGEVRNVVVHRNGIADKLFVERCPFVGAVPGEFLRVDGKKYRYYSLAVCWYLIELKVRLEMRYPSGATDETIVGKGRGIQDGVILDLPRFGEAETSGLHS